MSGNNARKWRYLKKAHFQSFVASEATKKKRKI